MDRVAWWATVCGVTKSWMTERLTPYTEIPPGGDLGLWVSVIFAEENSGHEDKDVNFGLKGECKGRRGNTFGLCIHIHNWVAVWDFLWFYLGIYDSPILDAFSSSSKSQFSSVQFSHSVVSDSLWPHESQHTRPPCPSPTPGVHPDSCALSWWCHPAISSSVVPFSSCPQCLPASGSFPVSQLFAWGGQSIRVSASASVH